MTDRLYESDAYAARSLDGCFWTTTAPDLDGCPPLEGEHRVEAAVIGAGFTGLSAALELAEAGMDVAVLDMHRPGWGASGRNGGFCCLGGSKLDRGVMRRRYGVEGARAYARTELAAIDTAAAQIERYGIEVDRHSDGEVMLAHTARARGWLDEHVDALREDLGLVARYLSPAELAAEGMASIGVQGPFHGGLHVPAGFALNPRRYALGLARALIGQGGRVHGESEVIDIRRDGADHVLVTRAGRLRARHLILATNGYSSDSLPPWLAGRFLPAQSSVIVTRPLSDDELATQGWTSDRMAYDLRDLLHYFRLMPDRRFLFGMRGAIAWTAASQDRIAAETRRHFRTMFPAWAGVETPHFWSGLVCLARDLVPHVGPLGDMPNAHLAFAYHGNGVAMASWAGRQAARMTLGQDAELPAPMRQAPPRFELGRYRRLLLRAVYARASITDRL